MSGHNPHGHLSQPNSSWNPLQIPSYIPRQPQLAHMSNERPLTWRTPTPPEAIYSFISANHKNLELNPLLPSFVRGPAPFGSMDLTIQSARNSTTPSPRNITSPPPEFVHNKSIPPPCNVSQSSLSNSISPNPGVIQTTGSIREKYANSNGNNGELPSPGGLFVRDVRQINNELVKMANREAIEDSSEPVELIKESSYQALKGHAVPTSPKRLSPARPPSISCNTPLSPQQPESQVLPLSTINTMTELVNNHVMPPQQQQLQQQQQQQQTQKSTAETITTTDHSPICSAVPSPANTTSNEDSVDSSASKTRRKRKPNKTVRVPNESDDSLPSNSEIDSCPPKISEMNLKSGSTIENEISLISAPPPPPPLPPLPLPPPPASPSENIVKDASVSNGNEEQVKNSIKTTTEAQLNYPQQPITLTPECKDQDRVDIGNDVSQEQGDQKCTLNEEKCLQKEITQSVIVENTVNRNDCGAANDKVEPGCSAEKEITSRKLTDIKPADSAINCLESPMKRSKRKGDSDDIETIDKIAAMIANTNDTERAIDKCTLRNINKKCEGAQDENDEDQDDDEEDDKDVEAQNCSNSSNTKINDLTEILTAPISSEEKPSQESLETTKENCFQEVENKLEEMFAGIEDERPHCVEPSTMESCETQEPTEVACDLDLELPQLNEKTNIEPPKEINANEQNQQQKINSMSQKRAHSTTTKNEQVPPKKKRKTTKKPMTNQKNAGIKSKSKHTASGKTTTGLEKSGGSGGSGSASNSLKDKTKDEAIIDIKYKGPYVQVRPDGSINVVNAPTTEDDAEKLSKVKKSLHNHTNSERSKLRGLHVSTLSTKYDADTTDATWMCVFCKRGPHKMGLGDLFGPYIVTTSCEEFELSQKEPADDEFVSKRTKADMFQKQPNMLPVVPAANASINLHAGSGSCSKKKRKTTDSPNIAKTQQPSTSNSSLNTSTIINPKEFLIGMSQVSETTYEVWTHEDCAIWAPGVYLVGARIVGLEAAVWSSTRYKCSICSHNGSIISCLRRGCKEKAHIPCARSQLWTVNENEFKCMCASHSESSSSVS